VSLSTNISNESISQLDGLSSQVSVISNLPSGFNKALFTDFALSQISKLVDIEKLLRKLIEKILEDLDICELMGSLPLDEIQAKLTTLIKLRDEAVNLLIKVLRTISNILSITTIISTLVNIFTLILNLIPIIAAAIPMAVPPGIGLPAGIPVIFSKIIGVMNDFLSVLGFILNLINNTLSFIAKKINKLINILKAITLDLFQCAEKLAIAKTAQSDPRASSYSPQTISIAPQDLQQKILYNFNSLVGELSPIPEISLGIQPVTYKGFTFDIKIKKTVEGTPQNYAIALDSRNIPVLEGQPSFASDTNVLIQELKLIIDRQNLSGF
jgi:hypothetical protein